MKLSITILSEKGTATRYRNFVWKKMFEQTNSMYHLGNKQESNFKSNNSITERCQKARNALFAMSAQGLHLYGLNPITPNFFIIDNCYQCCSAW